MFNLPATVSLVVLLLIVPLALLHVTSTVFATVTVSFEVSVTSELDSEVAALHRTVLYAPDNL